LKTNNIVNIIKLHLAKYPDMEIGDMVKLIYQSEFGGGHLIEIPLLSYEQILAEMESLPDLRGNICEDISERISRIYLSPLRPAFAENQLSAKIINALFTESAGFIKGSTESYFEKLDILLNMIEQKELSSSGLHEESRSWTGNYSFSRKYVESHKSAGCPMLRHSESYREKYKPAYRIVLNEFVPYIDLFRKIEAMAMERKRLIIAIDGKCGSGKSTLAKIISRVYGCPVIRVDDFFLPAGLRIEERLNAPGGNVHYERFTEEVIKPLSQGKSRFSHKVFDCHVMDYTPKPKEIDFSNILVIEGSYSMRPEFRGVYDISVFLEASPDIQKSRIISRSGEPVYKMFEQKWIPMENRYFEHFNISENCDIVYKV